MAKGGWRWGLPWGSRGAGSPKACRVVLRMGRELGYVMVWFVSRVYYETDGIRGVLRRELQNTRSAMPFYVDVQFMHATSDRSYEDWIRKSNGTARLGHLFGCEF